MAALVGKFAISTCIPDCKDRSPGCHGKCEKYIEAQKEFLEKKKDFERKKREDDYFFSVRKGRKYGK